MILYISGHHHFTIEGLQAHHQDSEDHLDRLEWEVHHQGWEAHHLLEWEVHHQEALHLGDHHLIQILDHHHMGWVHLQEDMDHQVMGHQDMDLQEDHQVMDLQVLVHKECMAHLAQEAHQVECMVHLEDHHQGWDHQYHHQAWDHHQW